MVYFKSSLFRNIALVMNLWRKQRLTLLAVTIIQVSCGGTTLLGDKLSVYRAESSPRGKLSEHSCTQKYYWMLKHRKNVNLV